MEDELLGELAVEFDEEFVLEHEFAVPLGGVDFLDFVKFLFGERVFESAHVDILILRHPSDGGFDGVHAELAALDDPFEDAGIVAEARPEEFAVGVFAEPVDVENAWQVFDVVAHFQPVGKVVAHVVAAEWEHGHGVAANLPKRANGGGGHFGTDGRTDVNTVDPVEGLEDEGHRGGAASAENDGTNGDAGRVLPIGIDDGAIFCRGSESTVGMAGEDGFVVGVFLVGRPVFSFPVDEVFWGRFAHSLPPDVAIVGEGDVGEDTVAKDGVHRHGIAFVRGARRDAEEAGFGIDGTEFAVGAGFDPCDVIADAGDLPALVFEDFWRDEHGEVGLAAGARKSGTDVGFVAGRIFHPEDEHVLGHPALVAGHGGGDAEGEAFFPEEGIAAVSGAEAHDEAFFGEVGDVSVVGVARPRDILSAWSERTTDGVDALDVNAGLGDLLVNGCAHAGHDAHVGHNVRAVGDFDAVLGDGGADGTHAEGDDVEGAAFHAAFE